MLYGLCQSAVIAWFDVIPAQCETMQLSVQKRTVEDFEELRGVVPTARTEVTQVDAGRLYGKLSHYLVGDLPLDLASFSAFAPEAS